MRQGGSIYKEKGWSRRRTGRERRRRGSTIFVHQAAARKSFGGGCDGAAVAVGGPCDGGPFGPAATASGWLLALRRPVLRGPAVHRAPGTVRRTPRGRRAPGTGRQRTRHFGHPSWPERFCSQRRAARGPLKSPGGRTGCDAAVRMRARRRSLDYARLPCRQTSGRRSDLGGGIWAMIPGR